MNPDSRFTDPQWGHISLATSRVNSISQRVCSSSRRHRPYHGGALAAGDICHGRLVRPEDTLEAATAIRIAEILMRYGRLPGARHQIEGSLQLGRSNGDNHVPA